MAKQGQHKGDGNDPSKSHGHNNPDKSMTITAGSPKKKETFDEQARNNEDTGKQAQAQRNEWHEATRDEPVLKDGPRARESDNLSTRSGSDSNASRRTQG
jgi:hypothetical protein